MTSPPERAGEMESPEDFFTRLWNEDKTDDHYGGPGEPADSLRKRDREIRARTLEAAADELDKDIGWDNAWVIDWLRAEAARVRQEQASG